ncbi:hypothetical protein JRQ81_010262 [Phrynocephalus forsythii]|uniref:Dehydrogenase/reductase SDR family member 7B n=1 Tax=Phrynocephalus forsythii TaxID=171643 RepID=A0A9Q0X865_9SAUR|nr:hypothetical protein JRQ81_010262 [Phrynocephalus forsythii]
MSRRSAAYGGGGEKEKREAKLVSYPLSSFPVTPVISSTGRRGWKGSLGMAPPGNERAVLIGPAESGKAGRGKEKRGALASGCVVMVTVVARRIGHRGKPMALTSTVALPLLFGSLGLFGLFRLLRRMRARAYLKDAVVVITGATSGLGKECAKAFHAAGSKLVLCGRNREKLQDLLKELSATSSHIKNPHKHRTVAFDLSDINAVVRAAEEILKGVDRVDVLINNAGISYRGSIVDMMLEVDRKVMETNYFGPVALTKALLPSMIKQKKGHIVVISSVQGRFGLPFRSA